jgi:hypothetical protein
MRKKQKATFFLYYSENKTKNNFQFGFFSSIFLGILDLSVKSIWYNNIPSILPCYIFHLSLLFSQLSSQKYHSNFQIKMNKITEKQIVFFLTFFCFLFFHFHFFFHLSINHIHIIQMMYFHDFSLYNLYYLIYSDFNELYERE